jgi:hypothetical protein
MVCKHEWSFHDPGLMVESLITEDSRAGGQTSGGGRAS